jgi:hypothetical protein
MIGVLAMTRDEETMLPKFFTEMESLERATSNEIVYSFYENDSKDNTPSIISQWIRKNNRRGSLVSESLGLPRLRECQQDRTKLMAMGRNMALSQLKIFDPNILVVIDVDINFSYEHILALFSELDNDNVAVACAATMQNTPCLFGNGKFSYYDSWAFIANDGSPGISFSYCPSMMQKDHEQWQKEKRITARSAFGGIAVMRYSDVVKQGAQWNGDNGCEHWSFCDAMRPIGDIVTRADITPMIFHEFATIPIPEFEKEMKKEFAIYNGIKL